jgi:hypothetical protein
MKSIMVAERAKTEKAILLSSLVLLDEKDSDEEFERAVEILIVVWLLLLWLVPVVVCAFQELMVDPPAAKIKRSDGFVCTWQSSDSLTQQRCGVSIIRDKAKANQQITCYQTHGLCGVERPGSHQCVDSRNGRFMQAHPRYRSLSRSERASV